MPLASRSCLRWQPPIGGVGLLGASPAVVPVKPGGLELQPAGADLLGWGRPAAWDPDGGGVGQRAAASKSYYGRTIEEKCAIARCASGSC